MTDAKKKKLTLELYVWLRKQGLDKTQVESLPRCVWRGFIEGVFTVAVIQKKTDDLRFGVCRGRPEGVKGHVDYIKFAKKQKQL